MTFSVQSENPAARSLALYPKLCKEDNCLAGNTPPRRKLLFILILTYETWFIKQIVIKDDIKAFVEHRDTHPTEDRGMLKKEKAEEKKQPWPCVCTAFPLLCFDLSFNWLPRLYIEILLVS